MNSRLFIVLILFFVTSSQALAQAVESNTKAYDKDGLKFTYPSDWTITDKSNGENQQLQLAKPGSQILFVIVSPRERLKGSEEYMETQDQVYQKHFNAFRGDMSAKKDPSPVDFVCLDFKGETISGTRYRGNYKGEISKIDFYPLNMHGRFVGLLNLRALKDEAAGEAGWQTLITSLSIAANPGQQDPGQTYQPVVDAGAVNGIAVFLAKPSYLQAAREGLSPWVSIPVKVLIDENGRVVSSRTKNIASQSLRKACESAALRSRFSPTIRCGKRVPVWGVITYNFEPRR